MARLCLPSTPGGCQRPGCSANVNAPWLVAAGVSAITATASAVGPLCVAVGPELPATHAADILDVGILGYVHVPRPLGHPLGRWKR